MNLEKLAESISKHEGLSLLPYDDTEGFITIGFGTNIDAGISLEQAKALRDIHIKTLIAELDKKLPDYKNHNEARQNVIIEMAYNLGIPRLLKFKKMLSNLEKRDYNHAALEMLNSRWREQVGRRAETLADQMQSGEFK